MREKLILVIVFLISVTCFAITNASEEKRKLRRKSKNNKLQADAPLPKRTFLERPQAQQPNYNDLETNYDDYYDGKEDYDEDSNNGRVSFYLVLII